MRVLRARLLALALEEQAAKDSATRGSQIRTMDRSEKIRTYNWPDNRIADHRSGYKANNLMQVLDGDLDPVIQSMVDADNEVGVRVSVPRSGWLVLSDSWYPGWTAAVDGRSAPVVQADHFFRAVRVPAGTHQVRFRYEPLSLRAGLATSGVALLAFVCSLLWVTRRPSPID